MLPEGLVQEVRARLDEGDAHRAINRELRISRHSIAQIAAGQQRRASPGGVGPEYVRCPGCGKRVELPCVYCRAVSYAERRERGRTDRARLAA